jgi:hypothetical protein
MWYFTSIARQGRRHPGRPKTTWQRPTAAEAKSLGLSWGQIETADRDRGRWRTLVDDLCPDRGWKVWEEKEDNVVLCILCTEWIAFSEDRERRRIWENTNNVLWRDDMISTNWRSKSNFRNKPAKELFEVNDISECLKVRVISYGSHPPLSSKDSLHTILKLNRLNNWSLWHDVNYYCFFEQSSFHVMVRIPEHFKFITE